MFKTTGWMTHCFGFCLLTTGGQVVAAPSFAIGEDPRNPIPGTWSIGIVVDGDGADWTNAGLKVDLTTGSVYNSTPDHNTPQSAFWPLLPDLEWDSWFGIPGDVTNSIAGGQGDFGGGPLNIGGTGVDAVSVAWFNINTANRDISRIANITFSDDATGTYRFETYFSGQIRLYGEGTIAMGAFSDLGALLPEPGTLALMGPGIAGLARRRRHASPKERTTS